MKLKIVRVSCIGSGCYGVFLREDGTPFIVTLERTFDDGLPVIPAGTYRCVRTRYYRGNYETFEITGVPGHSRLLIHKANWEEQLQGCIATGTSFEVIDGKPGVAGSGQAFAEFVELTKGLDEFQLTIV